MIGVPHQVPVGCQGELKERTAIYYDSPRQGQPDSFLAKGTEIELNGINDIDGFLWINTANNGGYVDGSNIQVWARQFPGGMTPPPVITQEAVTSPKRKVAT